MATRIAWLGLGRMGVPMAGHVAGAEGVDVIGYDVIGYDVTAAARDRAAAAGLTVTASLEEAVDGADVVILMLPGSPQIEEVVGQIADSLAPGTIVMDMSSSEPLSTRRLAEDLSARDVSMMDAPVSGGVVGAEAGTLTIMAGGEDALIDRVEPLLTTMGRVIRTGAVGSGHALKAINNLLSGTTLLISSEALHAGRQFGLTDEVMLSVINTSTGRSWSTEFKWPTFVVPETYDSAFAMALLVKDMQIAVSMARALGLPSVLGEASLERWRAALETLGAQADHTEIAKFAGLSDASA